MVLISVTVFLPFFIGKEELLPTILCGDMNSTPGSPLYNFITTSFLDYSKMSAVEIAGYYNSHRRSRVIPKPLLPASMNIGGDCRFSVTTETQPTAVIVDLTEDSTPDDVLVIDHSECSNDGTIAVVTQEPGGCTKASPKFTSTQTLATGFVELDRKVSKEKSGSESVMEWESEKQPDIDLSQALDLNCSVNKPLSTSKGLSPTVNQCQAENFKKSVSLVDRPVSVSEGLSTTINQHQAMRTVPSRDNLANTSEGFSPNTESNPRRNADNFKCNPDNERRQSTLPDGLLTHPFRFNSVYPYSSQSPRSTITTFHQSAFETVDYIFYTPTSCSSNRDFRSTGEANKVTAGFHLLSRKVLPCTHTLLELGPQPHEFLSSDHLLLQATFQLLILP